MLIRNLWRRPMRTMLTLLGIAVGIAVLVTLVALSRGIASSYSEATQTSEADITIQAMQKPGQAISFGTGFDESLGDRIRAMPEVKSVSGMLYSVASMPGVPFFIVYGHEPEGVGIQHFKITEGVSLADYRSRAGGKPLVLGKTAADSLHKRVGDTLRIEAATFRVVGIYETGTGLEDAAAVIALREAQMLFNFPKQIMYLGVQLYRPERVEEFKAKLERTLPRDVEVAGTQAGNMMLDMLKMLDYFAWAVAMIAALVGGVGMMNTMLMSVFERTREIGLLRAVGWRPGRVLTLILGESLLLSLLGGGIGLALGMGLTYTAAHAPSMAGMTKDTVPLPLIAQALLATILLGLVGGIYPAWRASRMPPVEALSYEGGSMRKRASTLAWGGMTLKNVVRQRTRTALTLVGVGIGVLGMLLMGSVTEGTIRTFDAMFADSEISGEEGGKADSSLSVVDERVLRRIAALHQVKQVSGIIFSIVALDSDPFFVVIARERTDPMLNSRVLREGRLIAGPRECLLGWKAANQHKKVLGDRLAMLGTTFRIVGIIETGSTFEDGGVVIGLRDAQRLLKKPHQVMMVQVKLHDPGETDAVLARLRAEYPKLIFSRSAEFTESLPDMQSMYASVNAIFALTMLVGSIALMNTMIMSVYERTREIGVLRAVGWRRGMVLRQVLAEGLLVTLLSGGAGLLLTEMLILAMRGMPGFLGTLFVVTPRVIAQAIGLCMALGTVGGLYPAWRATKLSPVEALRYE